MMMRLLQIIQNNTAQNACGSILLEEMAGAVGVLWKVAVYRAPVEEEVVIAHESGHSSHAAFVEHMPITEIAITTKWHVVRATIESCRYKT